MGKAKIPKRFKQYGQTIVVTLVKRLAGDVGDYGEWLPLLQRINIQDNVAGVARSQEQIGQNFYHERFHQRLEMAGYPKLSKDETFVDRMAYLEHQADVTAEYK